MPVKPSRLSSKIPDTLHTTSGASVTARAPQKRAFESRLANRNLAARIAMARNATNAAPCSGVLQNRNRTMTSVAPMPKRRSET